MGDIEFCGGAGAFAITHLFAVDPKREGGVYACKMD